MASSDSPALSGREHSNIPSGWDSNCWLESMILQSTAWPWQAFVLAPLPDHHSHQHSNQVTHIPAGACKGRPMTPLCAALNKESLCMVCTRTHRQGSAAKNS